jgi:adenylate cyclase, class 2
VQPNYTETEVKLYVPDLHAVEMRLQALGATLTAARVFERNVRYDDAEHQMDANDIVLRLRQDDRVRLTYKDPPNASTESGIYSRFEAEVEVSDFDTMAMILNKLGYVAYMVYEKYRTTYTLDDAEIVLDEMPYGNFVEIEGEAATIERLIEQLGLANAPRFGASYAGLFDRVRQSLGLTFNDLTFKNFEGIDVPERAFKNPTP